VRICDKLQRILVITAATGNIFWMSCSLRPSIYAEFDQIAAIARSVKG
jgi:hypothetical protein